MPAGRRVSCCVSATRRLVRVVEMVLGRPVLTQMQARRVKVLVVRPARAQCPKTHGLRAFVLVDPKLGKPTHQDLGQMQMYGSGGRLF